MKFDVIVIGAGLSGLACASLLSKSGLKVLVVEASYKPGGSCGIFKREDTIFEQGTSMIYGFGERGFNPLRFLFNALQEDIDVIKHEHLYAVNYEGQKIIFYEDISKYISQLVEIFPNEVDGIHKFYKHMKKIYQDVIAESPSCVAPDIVDKKDAAKRLLKHPLSYFEFLSYMNKSAKDLLKKYFKSDEILNYFDKLTSTYCYATVEEAPAVLAAVMFIDNHMGGSYYPVGSTQFLVGKLEKVIEENGGAMKYLSYVDEILVDNNKAIGIKANNKKIYADSIVYSGNVWDLYNELIENKVDKSIKNKYISQIPTYSSLVLYARVNKEAIPNSLLPIEMIVNDKNRIDEGEITVYVPSIDDKTLCNKDEHTLIAVGPTFLDWETFDSEKYNKVKKEQIDRMLGVIERIIPNIRVGLISVELSTPKTLIKYTHKYHGAVAGPKQQIGQHMLNRQNTVSYIEGLYCCGESTVMGTGAPAVVVSGISACNAILRAKSLKEYSYEDVNDKYVHLMKPPYNGCTKQTEKSIIQLSQKCQFCEKPSCEMNCPNSISIMSINRRVAVGNIIGAKKLLSNNKYNLCMSCESKICENVCMRNKFDKAVEIKSIIEGIHNE